jgi:hypothetical protein
MHEFYFKYMLEFYFILKYCLYASDACYCFFNISSVMVSKHSELMKRQARDCYGMFASPSIYTAHLPSCQELASFSCCRTAPSPSHMQEVGSSSRRHTAPPPLHQRRLHRMTQWRCGWSAAPLFLLYAWCLLLRHTC